MEVEEPKRIKLSWMWYTLLAVTILVGYPLSVGPVAWLKYYGLLPTVADNILTMIYLPLGLVIELVPDSASELYLQYLGLWVDLEI